MRYKRDDSSNKNSYGQQTECKTRIHAKKDKLTERIEVYEFFDVAAPPKEAQIVFVVNGEFRRGFDVRRDVLGKGVCIYEQHKESSN